MSLDNIKLSYGQEQEYTAIKADFMLNTLEINKDMNNRVKLNLSELSDLIDILLKLQSIDILERLDGVESLELSPIEVKQREWIKINYD